MDNLKGLIGIAGADGVGKTTLAYEIMQSFVSNSCQIESFAIPLYMEIMQFLGYQKISKEKVLEFKKSSHKDEVRPLLRTIGKERRDITPDYWVNKLEERINTTVDQEFVIIDDIRFLNEGEMVVNNSGTLVYLKRGLLEYEKDLPTFRELPNTEAICDMVLNSKEKTPEEEARYVWAMHLYKTCRLNRYYPSLSMEKLIESVEVILGRKDDKLEATLHLLRTLNSMT